MRVRVLFFGQLKEIVGRDEEYAELGDGARLQDLFDSYGRRYPKLAGFRLSVVASINQSLADWGSPLAMGDEVAFLPPVSGGAGTAAQEKSEAIVELVRERIQTEEISARLKAPEDGAIVVFEGIVRNHSQGRRTLYLDYEAYEAMALKEMKAIASAMRSQFGIDGVGIIHRLGPADWGGQRVGRGDLGTPRASFPGMPLWHRHVEANRPDLEEGILRRRGGMGRRRNTSAAIQFQQNGIYEVRRQLRRHLLSKISPTHFRSSAIKVIFCLIAGIAVLCISVAGSQNRRSEERSAIRVDVNLVNVIASVLDQNNRPAPDLKVDQFELYEDGKPQKIEVFEPETQQPLDLALMVDSSLSEVKELQFETEAAARFIGQVVRPEDRVGIFEFADAVTQ